MSTNIFSSIFTAESDYLEQQETTKKNSFLHLAVAIRNVARNKQDTLLSQLNSELDEYLKGKEVHSDSAFSKLSNLLNQLLKHDTSDRLGKIDRTRMPQIIPPRPDNCDTYFSMLTKENIDSDIEKIESCVKQGQNGLDDFISAIINIVTKDGLPFTEGCNVCKQEEFKNYIKRLFYLLIRFNETSHNCSEYEPTSNNSYCYYKPGGVEPKLQSKSYYECMMFSKTQAYTSQSIDMSLQSTYKWCRFRKMLDIISFLSKPTNNSLNYEINAEICCQTEGCDSHKDKQIQLNTLTGAQTDMSVFKSFNIALITLLQDSDKLFGSGSSSDYTGCKDLEIKDSPDPSLIERDSLKNISQKILVSEDGKVIDGHHNWAGLTIAFRIVQPESETLEIEVKQVSLSFIDYYYYAMIHPLVFSIDYNDNYVSRVRQRLRQRGGGARRKYKKKSRQRGGKRSRKSSRSSNRKARKTNKRRKRKITLKNMSPKLLEAFSTLNR